MRLRLLSFLSATLFWLAQPLAGQENPPKPWLTDFGEFVKGMRACGTTNPAKCELGTLNAARVTWEGTFTSFDDQKSVATVAMGTPDLTITVDGTEKKLICCSFGVMQPEKWKALTPGASVKFQASFNRLLPIIPAPTALIVALQDAVPVE
ncbi:MAG TPA: hypothetical protein VKM72_18285 [Thermoanaerobaculia bacterium]|nr:hypothetical protein [Thermoanaerobaculia bacterium]